MLQRWASLSARAPAVRALAMRQVRWASSGEPPAMAAVREDLKAAMRAGDSVTKTTLRAVMAAVKNANISSPGSVASDRSFRKLLARLVKQREKSIAEYEKGARADLAEGERAEIAVLQRLEEKLPAPAPSQAPQTGNSPKNTRGFATATGLRAHENPLGLPRRNRTATPGQPGGPGAGKKRIPGVRKVIAVSSAKGGVGKSTISVNLAAALFARGNTVGILDVDIFGPSLPLMLGLSDHSEPRLTAQGRLVPLTNYGLKAMSMGFLVPADRAVAWRGLLVQKALQQLLWEVDWGELDVLVIDLPPGTGDVQLTLAQQVEVDGAVIVSTPQDVALIDARRGIDMFRTVRTPILGMVQNMSVFVCPNCHTETHVFGHDGALREAERAGLAVLGSVPLSADIARAGDAGKPAIVDGSAANAANAAAYAALAANVEAALNRATTPEGPPDNTS